MGTLTAERRSPPYLPFKTFLNFIDMLANTVVPHRIDGSIMSKYPGSIKAQLRSALVYIGAIDETGIVRQSFRDLVNARGTDMWRDTFSTHFFNWYRDLLGDIDLDTASLAQLKDRLRDGGSDGSVLIKATRFFLAGLDEARATYSPHFKVRGALSGGGVPARQKKPKARASMRYDDGEADTSDEIATPQGFNKLSLPIKGGHNATLVLPSEMQEADWDMLSAYVRMYYGYAKPQK